MAVPDSTGGQGRGSRRVGWKGVLGGTVILAALGGFVATPYLAVHDMRGALAERDSLRFNQYVDYPALREDLKQTFRQRLAARRSRGGGEASSPLGKGLERGAEALAGPLIDRMVEALVTPEGLATVLAGGSLGGRLFRHRPLLPPLDGERPEAPVPPREEGPRGQGEKPTFSMGYTGINEFAVRLSRPVTDASAPEGERATVVLLLHRTGWVSWKLVALRLPE